MFKQFYDHMAARFSKSPAFLRIMLGGIKFVCRVVALPGLRKWHPWVTADKNILTPLPINAELQFDSVPLPEQILWEFIDRSSHRMIVNSCGCRTAYSCQNFPHDIGCLFLGESARDISAGLGRMVTKAEARAHVQKAIAAGLVPNIGKAVVDNFLFHIPERGKLIAICFCCHCCCMTRFYNWLPAEQIHTIAPPLPGLQVEVTDQCVGCGTCLTFCPYENIAVEAGKAVHGDKCRGCGRCAAACPEKAVRLTLDNPDFKQETIQRIAAFGDVT